MFFSANSERVLIQLSTTDDDYDDISTTTVFLIVEGDGDIPRGRKGRSRSSTLCVLGISRLNRG